MKRNQVERAYRIAAQIMAGEVKSAWSATTNSKHSGGLTDSHARLIIHRALKRNGYVFYVALFSGDTSDQPTWGRHAAWGLMHKSELSEIEHNGFCARLETGYSLNAAAAKLGGWSVYWSWQ